MSFTPLNQILPSAARAWGIKREVDAAIVCETYRQVAPTTIHPEALDHTRPKYFRRKKLTIGVDNAAWGAEILKNKGKLIAKLNELLGKKAVVGIQTRVDLPHEDMV